MEKFYNYLLDKNKLFLTKTEIKLQYEAFQQLWNLKKPFSKVFDSLRKTKLTYIIDNYWALEKKDILLLFQEFLNSKKISNYYGLESALYLNKKTWQPPITYYLLNTTYAKIRKIQGIVIKLVKIPKNIYNTETIVQDKITYSNYEKTILDLIYFKKQTIPKPENENRIQLYRGLYPKKVQKAIEAKL